MRDRRKPGYRQRSVTPVTAVTVNQTATRGAGLASTGSVATDPLVRENPETPVNRSVILKVRLTPAESSRLKEQSARTGRSMSDIIRSAWKKLNIIELPPADFAETVVQIRRVGNNLNQLTRLANAGEIKIPEIKEVLAGITALDRKISKILSGGGL